MEDEIINIFFKRGDTSSLKCKINLKSGSKITKEDVSELYFTVREIFDENFPIIFQKKIDDIEIYDEEIHIVINPEDTENLSYGTYCFDLEITLKGNKIIRKTKTGKFTLLGETTIHKNGSVVF